MEVNEFDNLDNIESSVFSDNDGLLQEYVSMEEIIEEGENEISSADELGFDHDNVRDVIDYAKLEASVRDAQIVNTLDSDLDDLYLTDVCLLVVILLLGILIGGRGK